MDNANTQDKPQESYTRASIENWLSVYTDAKESFFMAASREGDSEAENIAAQSYTNLLLSIHTLLELSKADNRNIVGNIMTMQEEVEAYDKIMTIDDKVIGQLRQLCAYIDTEILFPYLTTLKPQLNI